MAIPTIIATFPAKRDRTLVVLSLNGKITQRFFAANTSGLIVGNGLHRRRIVWNSKLKPKQREFTVLPDGRYADPYGKWIEA